MSKQDILKENRELKRKLAALTDQIKFKEELNQIVAHDLKGPLATIRASLELLEDLNDQTGEILKLIKRSRTCVDVSLTLIHDLLEVASLENELEINTSGIELSFLIHSVIECFSAQIEEKDIHVKANPQQIWIEGDYIRLHQVMTNLLGNAVKFSPEGGDIFIKVDELGNKVRLTIEDQGPGIPKDKLDTIFGKFQQARPEDLQQGTGLGLAICKTITELHDGSIEASNSSSGARFEIILPVNQTPKRLNILIVDDEESVHTVVGEKLASLGWTSFHAYNLKEETKFLRQHQIDAVLLDLRMPRIDPSDHIKHIKELIPNNKFLPIIAHTNLFDAEILHQIQDGVDGFLHKPASVEDLQIAISHATKKDKKSVASRTNKLILVCDDSEEIRNLLRNQLTNEGFKTVGAKSAFEALNLVDQLAPDLLLTDIKMPAMDGISLIKKLHHENLDLPTIILSGAIDSPPKKIMSKYNIAGFLNKPCDFNKLMQLVYTGLSDIEPKSDQLVNKHLSVLLVDDSEINCKILRQIIETKTQWSVDTEFDGASALQKFSNGNYDMILMDVMMPGLSGIEVARKIRQIEDSRGNRRIPLVAVTASDSESLAKSCFEAGYSNFIVKPIIGHQLIRSLCSIVNKGTEEEKLIANI